MQVPNTGQSSPVLNAIPTLVGGSTFLGMEWGTVVNILVAVSLTLQITWFIYDKLRTIMRRKNGKEDDSK